MSFTEVPPGVHGEPKERGIPLRYADNASAVSITDGQVDFADSRLGPGDPNGGAAIVTLRNRQTGETSRVAFVKTGPQFGPDIAGGMASSYVTLYEPGGTRNAITTVRPREGGVSVPNPVTVGSAYFDNFAGKHPQFGGLGEVVEITVREPGIRTQGPQVGENPFPRLLDLIRSDEARRAGGQVAGPKQVLRSVAPTLRGLANAKLGQG
ncbi:MAG: hypothetical protein AAB553_02870 [Patescibacteria group bacterium]